MILIGKNKDFVAEFDCNEQAYLVYYKNKLFTIKYKRSEIESYLN